MSLPSYEKYKDSGVDGLGPVPSHWDVTRLMWTASVNDDVLPESTLPTFEIEYVDIGSVSLDRGIQRTEQLSFANAPSRARRLVRDGDVLVSTVRTYLKAIAPVVSPPENLVVSTGFAVLRPKPQLNSTYAKYAIQATGFVDEVISRSTGVSYPAINVSDLIRIFIPVPLRGEQVAIAAFLDRETAKIDALIAEQEKLISLLAEKRQATISHAVTRGLNPDVPMKDSRVDWLGQVPAHWEVRTISSVCTKITNGFVGPTRDILVDEGVRYLQSLHIKGNTIRFENPYFVRREWSSAHRKSVLAVDDVLIVQTGDIGQVAVVTDEFAGSNCHALIIVAPVRNLISGRWLSWVLNSDYGFHSLLSIQTGALHPHLNCGNVKTLFVPLPPKNEQLAIAAHIENCLGAFKELTIEAERTVALLKERRSALITAAVTGQIDVRGAVPQPDQQEELAA